jgi:GAF domain-containing protein
MRATTVRFGEDLWAMLEREAENAGVSAAQFVREATILRIAMLAGLRGDDEARTTLARIAADAAVVHENGNGAVGRTVNDPRRLAALRATGLLDTPTEERFDALTVLASRVLRTPVALVSLVDEDRQFFKSCLGLPEPWASRRETPLSHSFCQHAIAAQEPLIVEDARKHPALHDNEAIRDLGIVAYAGVPLVSEDGQPLGTLCVIDHQPRQWTDEEIDLLRGVARAVAAQVRVGA